MQTTKDLIPLLPFVLLFCVQDRIGAVACIQLAVKEGNIDDDVLVIGG